MKTMKRWIWATLCLSPFILTGKALAWGGRGYTGWAPWSCGWMGNWGWGWPGMILGIAFWIVVAMAIIYLIRRIVQDTRGTGPSVSKTAGPLDILKTRYARGEITAEDFHRMRKELE